MSLKLSSNPYTQTVGRYILWLGSLYRVPLVLITGFNWIIQMKDWPRVWFLGWRHNQPISSEFALMWILSAATERRSGFMHVELLNAARWKLPLAISGHHHSHWSYIRFEIPKRLQSSSVRLFCLRIRSQCKQSKTLSVYWLTARPPYAVGPNSAARIDKFPWFLTLQVLNETCRANRRPGEA